jgi:hydrogenase maturation protein HypF
MVRDLEALAAYCEVEPAERAALREPAAPIVLLRERAGAAPAIAAEVAPLPPGAERRLGVMLPSTPLHLLALRAVARPVVCTSGNRSDEPQVIDDAEVEARLGDIADWVVGHDRPIHSRVDDSVVRVVDGRRRIWRRARGYAPAPLPLPPGFEAVAGEVAVLAAGTDLKATVCLSRARDLVLSPHLGDLDDALASEAYVEQQARLMALFEHQPTVVAVDNHPESRAAAHGRALATARGLPVVTVAHHHAHLAACLGEHRVARDAAPVLGVILDGIGAGDESGDGGGLWGGELLLGGYVAVRRVAALPKVALLGGDRAAREPWRCLYAHLRAVMGWGELDGFAALPVIAGLRARPVAVLEQLLATGLAAPPASSCGRLFDAVAAALGICVERQRHEAQAAMALEALVTPAALAAAEARQAAGAGYLVPLGPAVDGVPRLALGGLWRALLADLAAGEAAGAIAARFHVGLAEGLAAACAAVAAAEAPRPSTVALSGGCFQNAALQGLVEAALTRRGFAVLTHAEIPANDGGVAFGQALVALAQRAPTQP